MKVTCVPAAPLVGETAVTIGPAGGKGLLTVTVVLPAMPLKVAVTLALPFDAGTTTAGLPEISKTVATAVLEEPQVASDVKSSVLPSE